MQIGSDAQRITFGDVSHHLIKLYSKPDLYILTSFLHDSNIFLNFEPFIAP